MHVLSSSFFSSSPPKALNNWIYCWWFFHNLHQWKGSSTFVVFVFGEVVWVLGSLVVRFGLPMGLMLLGVPPRSPASSPVASGPCWATGPWAQPGRKRTALRIPPIRRSWHREMSWHLGFMCLSPPPKKKTLFEPPWKKKMCLFFFSLFLFK